MIEERRNDARRTRSNLSTTFERLAHVFRTLVSLEILNFRLSGNVEKGRSYSDIGVARARMCMKFDVTSDDTAAIEDGKG